MPGRRTPSRRAVAGSGGGSPVLGTLVIGDSVSLNVTAGAAPQNAEIVPIVNGGPGTWSGAPSLSIAYSDTEDWLTLTSVRISGGLIEVTPTIDATALTEATEVATVTVTDTRCSNSPQQFTVTAFVAADDPTLFVTPGQFATSVVDETVLAFPLNATISNIGGGAMATPTVGAIAGTGAAYMGTPVITGSGPWNVAITPDATGGTPGSYGATIPIISAGATNTPQNIVVVLDVRPAAQQAFIATARTLDDASSNVGTAPPDVSVQIFSTTPNVPLISPSITGVVYSGVNSNFVTVTISGSQVTAVFDDTNITAEGSSNAVVTLTAQNASNSTDWTIVLKAGAAPPQALLTASPSAVGRSITVGDPATSDTVIISNSGTGGLAGLGVITANMLNAPAWCSASYLNGLVTLQYTSFAVAGTYNGTLSISASLATNNPTNVAVQVIASDPTPVSGNGPIVTLPNTNDVGGTDAAHDAGTDTVTWVPFVRPLLSGYT